MIKKRLKKKKIKKKKYRKEKVTKIKNIKKCERGVLKNENYKVTVKKI